MPTWQLEAAAALYQLVQNNLVVPCELSVAKDQVYTWRSSMLNVLHPAPSPASFCSQHAGMRAALQDI